MPVPGVGVTSGPQYATDLNACLSIIDSHTHTPGSGVQITPGAININSDLTFGGNNATNMRSARMSINSAPLSASTDLACIYASGVDLYFNDANGNQVRITANGGVSGTPGSIANLVSPAACSYVGANTKFTFQSDSGGPTAANLDAGSILMRNLTAASYALTLAPPTLTNNYTITLPALPASSGTLSIDASGNITASTVFYSSFVPAGGVMMFAGTSAPTGYLMCDGSAVSRTTYAALYAVIGDSCGSGNGTTTFNLPDYRGRFIRGTDGGSGRDPDSSSRTAMASGGNTGNNVGSVQTADLASHGHLIPLSTNTGILTRAVQGTGTTSGNGNSGLTGGNETRPINAYANFIIKY